MHAREVPEVVRALRGVGGVGTHTAQHWVQLTGECGSLWLAKYKQTNRLSIARLITVK